MKKIFQSKNCAVLTTFLLCLIISACGPTLKSHDDKKRSAPKNEKDLGVLVSAASEEELTELLNQYPQAQFRTLNRAAGLYEVFNVHFENVRSAFESNLNIQVSKNKWIANPNNSAVQADGNLELFADSAEGLTSGDEMQIINRCFRDNVAPRARMFVVSPKGGIPVGVSVEMGTEIELLGRAEAHPLNPSPLTRAFAVVAPGEESGPGKVIFGDSVKIKTMAMGIYRVVYIVQDNRDVCTMVQTFISVTANREFVGNDFDTADRLVGLKLSDFDYLNRIEGEQAWSAGNSGKDITIAVIDSGVNFNHPALVKNILVNSGEIQGNGIDDDQNGLIDDYVGYDFVNDDGSPYDDGGHGSHVAGLAASSVFGVAKDARILSVKAMGPMGSDTGTVAAAIRYAVDRKAKVLNISLGTYGDLNSEFKNAVRYAEEKNVLVVAASGNGHPFFGTGLDTDRTPIYPSSLTNSNILSVAATTKGQDGLAKYSNFGLNSVDIAAPGGDDPDDLLNSCYFENPLQEEYKGMSGTSMASPIVAGAAAVVLSINPNLTPAQVTQILMDSGTKSEFLRNKIKSGAILNVRAAAEMAKSF